MKVFAILGVALALCAPVGATSSYDVDDTLAPGTPVFGGAAIYDFFADPGDVVDVVVSWDPSAGPLDVSFHEGRLVDDCLSIGLPFCSSAADVEAAQRAQTGESCGLAHASYAQTSPVHLRVVVPPTPPGFFGYWLEVRSPASPTPIAYHLSLQVNGQAPYVRSTWHGTDVNYQAYCEAQALVG